NNCQEPAGWTSLPAVTGGGSTFSGSQSYNLNTSPFSSILSPGSSFLIGVDVNDTNQAQIIDALSVSFNTGQTYTLTPVPVSIPNTANGVGFSDFMISLNGGAIPIPINASSITFSLQL